MLCMSQDKNYKRYILWMQYYRTLDEIHESVLIRDNELGVLQCFRNAKR